MVWPARPLNSSILGIRTGDRDMFVSATHQSAKRVTINHTSAEKKSVSKKNRRRRKISVRRLVMNEIRPYKNHPVDLGRIQGSHRPISIMISRYRTRANGLTITFETEHQQLPRT